MVDREVIAINCGPDNFVYVIDRCQALLNGGHMLIRACMLYRTNTVVELLKYKVVGGVNLRVYVGGIFVFTDRLRGTKTLNIITKRQPSCGQR